MGAEEVYLKKIKDKLIGFDGIIEVRDIGYLALLDYTPENESIIDDLLKRRLYEKIGDVAIEKKSTHDLLLFKFYDQNDRLVVATVYDNDQLWQDPRVLKIYPQ